MFFAGIGIVAGFFAGLLGIGGGLVVIPCLFVMLGEMHLAIGTSLAAMVLTTLSSSIAHYRKRGIDWRAAFAMGPGIIAGAIVGPFIADHIPNERLRMIFGGFQIVVGIYLIAGRRIKQKKRADLSPPLLVTSGGIIGTIGGMLGIGGGVITVPFLHYVGMSMKRAVGTSAFMNFLVMTVGASSFFFLGGFIDGKAFVIISLAAFACAPLGAHVAHKVPGHLLRNIFGGVLVLAGMLLIF